MLVKRNRNQLNVRVDDVLAARLEKATRPDPRNPLRPPTKQWIVVRGVELVLQQLEKQRG